MSDFGGFINVKGYNCYQVRTERYLGIFPEVIFDFSLATMAPLTFVHPAGHRIRPDQHFETNKGSIPIVARPFIPKDRFERSFFFHDSGYIHHGLWIQKKNGYPFHFREMTRKQVDELLRMMVRAEGAGPVQACTIYTGVRAGGWYGWGQGHEREKARKKERDRVVE